MNGFFAGAHHFQLHAAEPQRWRSTVNFYTLIKNTQLLDQVRQLSVEDQLELVEALWDDIAKRNAVPPPMDAQKSELDRRLADHEANPDDVVSWREVKTSALARIGQ